MGRKTLLVLPLCTVTFMLNSCPTVLKIGVCIADETGTRERDEKIERLELCHNVVLYRNLSDSHEVQGRTIAKHPPTLKQSGARTSLSQYRQAPTTQEERPQRQTNYVCRSSYRPYVPLHARPLPFFCPHVPPERKQVPHKQCRYNFLLNLGHRQRYYVMTYCTVRTTNVWQNMESPPILLPGR